VVDEVLQHQDRARAGEHLVDLGQRTTVERGERTAVDVEAGDLLDHRLGHHVAGSGAASEHVVEPLQPPRGHQEGPRAEARLDGATHDLLALGEEQPVLGLEALAQLDVAQVAVVGQAGVVGVGDLDEPGGVSHAPAHDLRSAPAAPPPPRHRSR
jgi:hypothetical protein